MGPRAQGLTSQSNPQRPPRRPSATAQRMGQSSGTVGRRRWRARRNAVHGEHVHPSSQRLRLCPGLREKWSKREIASRSVETTTGAPP
eukprot:5636548-Pyramimonas_sp.AAC.1